MKTRTLSFILCLVMIITLALPSFSAKANDSEAGDTFTYLEAGNEWTGSTIKNWNNEDSIDGNLYVEIDDTYYRVEVNKEPYLKLQSDPNTHYYAFNNVNFPNSVSASSPNQTVTSESVLYVKDSYGQPCKLYYKVNYQQGWTGAILDKYVEYRPYYDDSHSSRVDLNGRRYSNMGQYYAGGESYESNWSDGHNGHADRENWWDGYNCITYGNNNYLVYDVYRYANDKYNQIYYERNGEKVYLDNIADVWDSSEATTNSKLYYRVASGDLVGYKSLTDPDENDECTLTIDSWTTGSVQAGPSNGSIIDEDGNTVTTSVTTKVPLDIALVIDQSGSMGTKDMGVITDDSYKVATPKNGSTWSADEVSNGTEYYCKVDGNYYPVKTENGNIYSSAGAVRANRMFGYGHDGISWGVNGTPVYYNVPTNYYIKYNGEMHKLFMITAGLDLHYGLYPYIYTDNNDSYINKAQWKSNPNPYWVEIFDPWGAKKLRKNSTWNDLASSGRISFVNTKGEAVGSSDSNGDSVKLWYLRELVTKLTTPSAYINNVYTAQDTGVAKLYYTDANGNKKYISNTRCESTDEFTVLTSQDGTTYTDDGKLYVIETDTSRVQVLQDAVNRFAAAIAEDAKENELDHRMAVIGFAGNKTPGISTGRTALTKESGGFEETTKLDYTDTGLFLNEKFKNYETVTNYSLVASSTADLAENQHYYVKNNAGEYQPIRYDYSTGRWYNVLTRYYLTSTTGEYYQAEYDSLEDSDYEDAMVSVYSSGDHISYNNNNSNEVNDDLDTAIKNFGYYGGTYTSYGLAMANQVFNNNDNEGRGTETTTTTKTKDGVVISEESSDKAVAAKRVVIVFTDGEPGASGFDDAIADEALAGGVESKEEADATVFTIGLYPGTSATKQVEDFLKHLSSEYNAQLNEATADNPSNLATRTSLDGNKTYFYRDSNDGKMYAVSAFLNNESTLGWWRDNGDGTYKLLSVQGKNGSGEDVIYSDSACTQDVDGEDADLNTVYYNEGKKVRYEYRWYDSNRDIVTPYSAEDHNGVKLYEITDQASNEDGEQYFFKATDSESLLKHFKTISDTLITDTVHNPDGGATPDPADSGIRKYGADNSKVLDYISSAFDTENAQVSVQVIPGVKLTDVVLEEIDSESNLKPEEGTPVDVIAAGNSSGNYDGKEIALDFDGKVISVSGFDFSKYYVTSEHAGAVLRIVVSGLKPNGEGTLYSNTLKSGIYESDEGNTGDLIYRYNNPSINVEPETYTVTWHNWDESTLETDESVRAGAEPNYDSEQPSRPDEVNGNTTTTYTFVGWSENREATPEQALNADVLPAVDRNYDYYAIYSASTFTEYSQYNVNWYNGSTKLGDTVVYENGDEVPKYDGAEPVGAADQFFVGWTTDPAGQIEVDSNGNVVSVPENFCATPSNPVKYYAGDSDTVNFYAVFMQSGTLSKETHKFVVSYSVKNVIGTDVFDFEVKSNPSGTFTKDKTGEAEFNGETYEKGTLSFTPQLKQDDYDETKEIWTYDLTPLSAVNEVQYYTGAPANVNRDRTLHTATVISGSSVYLDDSIVSREAVQESGEYNYTAALVDANETDKDSTTVNGVSFRFKGSRIDVYCTTDKNAGQVIASFYKIDENGEPAKKAEKTIIMKNATDNLPQLRNVPTISYSPADPNAYYLLKITAMKNTDYRLDGVRVYEPGQIAATVLNVRKELLNTYNADDDDPENPDKFAWDAITGEDAWGALYIDNVGNSDLKRSYKDYGPKNEVYLSRNQGIAFNIKDYTVGDIVRIGLSAPQGGEGFVKASGRAEGFAVNSVVDMYYSIVPMENGDVYIYNASDTVISITNVEINPHEKVASPSKAPRLRMMMSLKSYVENFETIESERLTDDNSGVEPGNPDDPGDVGNTETPQPPEEPGNGGTEQPSEGSDNTDTPNPPDDPGTGIDDGDSNNETPAVTDEPDSGEGNSKNTILSVIQKAIQTISKAINNLFRSIFRR